MYHNISNNDEIIKLQQYIENRDGKKRIGLKSIRYSVGWYNIVNGKITKGSETPKRFKDGYYSFQKISDEFKKENIDLSIDESNGIVSLNTPVELKMNKELRNILGFSNKRIFEPNKIHYGNKSVDFAIHKSLYLHLNQINTSYNNFNGNPSTLLSIIPVENKEFGDIVTVRFENPEYKYLVNGDITELKLEIRDENNKKITNNLEIPNNYVLEVI